MDRNFRDAPAARLWRWVVRERDLRQINIARWIVRETNSVRRKTADVPNDIRRMRRWKKTYSVRYDGCGEAHRKVIAVTARVEQVPCHGQHRRDAADIREETPRGYRSATPVGDGVVRCSVDDQGGYVHGLRPMGESLG